MTKYKYFSISTSSPGLILACVCCTGSMEPLPCILPYHLCRDHLLSSDLGALLPRQGDGGELSFSWLCETTCLLVPANGQKQAPFQASYPPRFAD